MGSKIDESQYAGKCDKCGKTWEKGHSIFYQKGENGGKATVCIDEKCWNDQGGKLSEYNPNFKKGGSTFQARPVKNIEQKLADIDVAYAHALGMLKDFQSKVGNISPSESAIFIESITRTTIQV